MTDEKKDAPKTKARVIKDGLTHAGKDCKVGDEIEVAEHDREFLLKREFIAPTANAAPAKAATKEA